MSGSAGPTPEDITRRDTIFLVSGALETRDDQLIAAVATGRSGDPFAVLGRHAVVIDGRPAVIVRTIQPAAVSVELITPGRVTPMARNIPICVRR